MANIFVQSNQVVGVGGSFYVYPNYTTGVVGAVSRQLSCTNMVLINSVWLIPQVQGAQVVRWLEEVAVNTIVPPTTDSIKAMKMKDQNDNQVYYIAIGLYDNYLASPPVNQFASLCDGTVGSLPVMPTVTIPFPVIEYGPALVANGANTFDFALPPNPLGLEYSIPAPTFNRLGASPAYAPSGLTTPANVATWANSNWSAYGTWSSTGNILKLTSNATPNPWVSGTSYVPGNLVTNAGTSYVNILATSGSTAPGSDGTHWTSLGATNIYVQTAGLIAALTPKAYCFDLTAFSTPAPVNQLVFGSSGPISLSAFNLTDVNAALIPILQRAITDPNVSFGTATAHKLTVYTINDTPKLYFNGASVVNASSGVCS